MPETRTETEILRMKTWAFKVPNGDLVLELDKYKNERDSCARKIGLLSFDSEVEYFRDLSFENKLKEMIIEVLQEEMQRRGIRS